MMFESGTSLMFQKKMRTEDTVTCPSLYSWLVTVLIGVTLDYSTVISNQIPVSRA